LEGDGDYGGIGTGNLNELASSWIYERAMADAFSSLTRSKQN